MPVSRNNFKRALLAQLPQIGLWSALPDPYVSEILAGAGFDWVMLDTEHNFGRIRDYVKSAQDELCLLVQVETGAALDNLEAIAAVDGVDGVFIGPADLSASLGHPGDPGHPEVRRAIDKAIRRIRACGKAPGILMIDEARASECLDLGALFVAVAMDLQILARGTEAVASRFASRPASSAEVVAY